MMNLDDVAGRTTSTDREPKKEASGGGSFLVEQIQTLVTDGIRERLVHMLLQWKEDWHYMQANADEWGDFIGHQSQVKDPWFTRSDWADDWALTAEESDWQLVVSLINLLTAEELSCLVDDETHDPGRRVLRAVLRAIIRKEGKRSRCLPKQCPECLKRINDGESVEAAGDAVFRRGQVKDFRVAFIHPQCLTNEPRDVPELAYWPLTHSELSWSLQRKGGVVVSRPSLRSCAVCGFDFWDEQRLVIRLTAASLRERRLHESYPVVLHPWCWTKENGSGQDRHPEP